MKHVYIKKIALGNVSKTVNTSITSLTTNVIEQLLRKEDKTKVDGLIVGNMLAPILQNQSQLASYIAGKNGLYNVDTLTIDAACGSGGSAIRQGVIAIKSGFLKNVIVLGVESMIVPDKQMISQSLAQASDWEEEGSKGHTFVSLNDMMLTEYLKRYDVDREDFYYFPENAHRNAQSAMHALLKKSVDKESYKSSKEIGNSTRLHDACPIANGCAAVLLSSEGVLGTDPIISGSSSKSDDITLGKREDLLELRALKHSVDEVLKQSNLSLKDIDAYELHDAYSIMSALSLESVGFTPKGKSLAFAKAGQIKLNGNLPISTFGGLKARGHPVGASGVYQLGEAVKQLKNEAGDNQITNEARNILISSFGGAASTVVSHVVSV